MAYRIKRIVQRQYTTFSDRSDAGLRFSDRCTVICE